MVHSTSFGAVLLTPLLFSSLVLAQSTDSILTLPTESVLSTDAVVPTESVIATVPTESILSTESVLPTESIFTLPTEAISTVPAGTPSGSVETPSVPIVLLSSTDGTIAVQGSTTTTSLPVTTLEPGQSTVYTTVVHTITSCAPTVTDCPIGHVTTSTIPVPSTSTGASAYTTCWTTAYVDICPTGITTNTYTLTHTCTKEACRAPTTVPEHFTVTTKVCTQCEGQPTLTVTCPVETGTQAPPAPVPTGTAATTVVCPGPECQVAPTTAAGCSGGNCTTATTTPGPYFTAGAERMTGSGAGAGYAVAILGGLVAALAWGL